MRDLLALIRILGGTVIATVVAFVIAVSVADGPQLILNELRSQNAPLGLMLWAVMYSIGFLLLWFAFTAIVELKTGVKVTTAVLIAAGLFGGYGAVLTVAVVLKGNGVVWKDFFATVAGGAAYGLVYWLLALLTKPRPAQT
jgi:hypothetical protein